MNDVNGIDRLLKVMDRLRGPGGCPWDAEQTFASIAPYTIEEAYEVADAIDREDLMDLKEELGDLLLQIVFHSRIAQDQGAFDFDAVAHSIVDKMVRRHPHVFADAAFTGADAKFVEWEAQKVAERAAKAASRGGSGHAGVLDDVPVALPGLTRAVKLTKRAARVGFDWPDVAQVFDKLREETAELEAELPAADPAKLEDELGDLLFVVANLARKLDVDPEAALRTANAKFIRRFATIEAALEADGRTPEQSDLAEMDGLWNVAKAAEKGR